MPWTAGSRSNWCGGKVRRRGAGELAREKSKPVAFRAKVAAPGCVHADKPKARISARIRRRREWMRRTEVVRSFGRPYGDSSESASAGFVERSFVAVRILLSTEAGKEPYSLQVIKMDLPSGCQ